MSTPDVVKVTNIVSQDRLNELLEKKNGPGLTFLAGHTATLIATGFLVSYTLETLWLIPALILHGIVVVHVFSPFHECSHGTAFKSPWLNKLIGWITGTALFLPPQYFRYEHIAHHNYTQMIEDDPEMIPMAERLSGYLYYATAIPYFYSNLLTLVRVPIGLFNQVERKFIPQRQIGRVQRETLGMWAVYTVLAAFSIGLETWTVVLYWLVPRFLGEPFMRLIRMSEHTGCERVRNILLNTRTVLTWAPIRWLAWNNAYHAEHHAIPTVPFFALGDLHETMGPHFAEVRHGYLETQAHLIKNGQIPEEARG